MVEDQVNSIIAILCNNVTWVSDFTHRTYSPDQLVINMLAYLEGGINKGYSTFYTYKRTYDIYRIVHENLAVSLVSPDPFVRQLAETIQKESVFIPSPYKE